MACSNSKKNHVPHFVSGHALASPAVWLCLLQHMPVVIFDFDRTLSADEIGQWHDHSNMRDRGFGGAGRLASLSQLLHDLVAGGTVLSICSYNSKAVICKALGIVGLAEFFDPKLIFGREVWEAQANSGRWSKADVLCKSIVPSSGAAPSDVCFVDDDPGHCRDVAASLPEACVIHVPQPPQRRAAVLPTAGLQAAQMEVVRRWAAARGACATVPSPDKPPVVAPPSAAPPGIQATDEAPVHVFVPKRPTGPLASRCAHCGAHISVH